MLEGTGLSNSVLACGGVLAELGTVQMFLAVCSSAQVANLKSEFSLCVPQCAGFSTPWRSPSASILALCQQRAAL